MDKVILTTGGTGGHIFPALATAQALKKHNPSIEILFMGSIYGPESKIAKKNNIDFIGLPVKGFMGRGIRKIPAFFGLAKSMGIAIKEINSYKPDVVAGFGGYASFAPVLAAKFLNLPILLHEQNAIAGASTKILSRFAKKVCISLPDTKGVPAESLLTGNPVRENIKRLKDFEREYGKSRRLLVIGGSQGAHALNMFIKNNAEFLVKKGLEIYHQTGEKDYEEIRDYYNSRNLLPSINVVPFINDMETAYKWADLAFCRSGATTIAELCVAGVPAIFIPFPAAIHDHQTLNAKILEKEGACKIIHESDLNDEATPDLIMELFKKPEILKSMSNVMKMHSKADAAERIADQIENLAASK